MSEDRKPYFVPHGNEGSSTPEQSGDAGGSPSSCDQEAASSNTQGSPRRAPLESAEIAKRRIAREIAEKLPVGWRFVLLLTSEDATTYVTNETRDPLLAGMLRDLADKIEKGIPGV